jgi:epoxyqueuosine reductase
MSLKQALLAEARALGFDDVRIAKAAIPPHASAFREWLAGGNHGEMAWLERNVDRRTNPDAVLEGVQSVIVLGLNYWQPGEGNGIARYAWGADYHEVMEPRLWKLDAWLTQHGGRQRQYVDTGPVLERDFAVLSGMGWHGKSTMVIHRKLGTWLFLGVIFTTLELDPDTAESDHCGTCKRCMIACPTGAIVEPRKVDARLCVSYLTIENKGTIPENLRRQIGHRIYGCDTCLDVCPWNRFAQESREVQFAARPFLGMRLRDFLELDDAAFRALFKGSPIKRIKRSRFLRNVCVALGNTGTEEDLPAMEKAASDDDALIAEHAAWGVSEIRKRLLIS